MRVLVDANLPRSVMPLLSETGHAPEFARDIGLASATDTVIAARARTTSATILTRDLDFADIRVYPPEQYAGIVVVRMPDDAKAQEIVALVRRFLREPSWLSALPGRLAILELDRVRFRPRLV